MTLQVQPILDGALGLALAFVLALPIGWEREQGSRSAGLPSYPFVSACVCGPEGARGMSTAVSLWVTGAIGAGVAYGTIVISAFLSVIV
jgi:putative Mg2+ transporter-C (MgtC) family protein